MKFSWKNLVIIFLVVLLLISGGYILHLRQASFLTVDVGLPVLEEGQVLGADFTRSESLKQEAVQEVLLALLHGSALLQPEGTDRPPDRILWIGEAKGNVAYLQYQVWMQENTVILGHQGEYSVEYQLLEGVYAAKLLEILRNAVKS